MAYDSEVVSKVINTMGREVSKLIERKYESEVQIDRLYLSMVDTCWSSMRMALELDKAVAVNAMATTLKKIVNDMRITDRAVSLTTFYDLTLENPRLTPKIMSYAAFYTLGAGFSMLYSYYSNPDQADKDTLKSARQLLGKTMYQVRKEADKTREISDADDE